MNMQLSFLLNAGGLFDFDLTFVAEGVLFIILSLVVTFGFLSPISKQLSERAESINYTLRKSSILVTFGYEKLSNAIELVTSEVTELNRQVKLTKSYTNTKFEDEVTFVQKETSRLLSKLKGDLSIKSACLLSTIREDLVNLTDTFFTLKFGSLS
jgi:F0F1-type ATP synthase membrane subunit b/b'